MNYQKIIFIPVLIN